MVKSSSDTSGDEKSTSKWSSRNSKRRTSKPNYATNNNVFQLSSSEAEYEPMSKAERKKKKKTLISKVSRRKRNISETSRSSLVALMKEINELRYSPQSEIGLQKYGNDVTGIDTLDIPSVHDIDEIENDNKLSASTEKRRLMPQINEPRFQEHIMNGSGISLDPSKHKENGGDDQKPSRISLTDFSFLSKNENNVWTDENIEEATPTIHTVNLGDMTVTYDRSNARILGTTFRKLHKRRKSDNMGINKDSQNDTCELKRITNDTFTRDVKGELNNDTSDVDGDLLPSVRVKDNEETRRPLSNDSMSPNTMVSEHKLLNMTKSTPDNNLAKTTLDELGFHKRNCKDIESKSNLGSKNIDSSQPLKQSRTEARQDLNCERTSRKHKPRSFRSSSKSSSRSRSFSTRKRHFSSSSRSGSRPHKQCSSDASTHVSKSTTSSRYSHRHRQRSSSSSSSS